MRSVGLDVHLDFCEVAVVEDGEQRQATPPRAFAWPGRPSRRTARGTTWPYSPGSRHFAAARRNAAGTPRKRGSSPQRKHTTPDLVEAAVRADRQDTAETRLTAFAEWAEHAASPYAAALVARCSGLHVRRGRGDRALRARGGSPRRGRTIVRARPWSARVRVLEWLDCRGGRSVLARGRRARVGATLLLVVRTGRLSRSIRDARSWRAKRERAGHDVSARLGATDIERRGAPFLSLAPL